MTALVWDATGTRVFEEGVDRGVLYLPSDVGVAWNGLISVSEKVTGNESTPVYYDGAKFSDIIVTGDYAATVSAYTYPDEFDEIEGTIELGNGLSITNQPPVRFGLSYRTRVGNDENPDAGYKIHVVYNLIATPAQRSYGTIGESSDPITFDWDVSAIPSEIAGFKPTAHLIFDSRKMSPLLLSDLETTLYGNEINPPTLPPMNLFATFVSSWVIIRIIDNFDGTWTAQGPDSLITMLDADTFQIIQANAVYVDADTYIVSNLTF